MGGVCSRGVAYLSCTLDVSGPQYIHVLGLRVVIEKGSGVRSCMPPPPPVLRSNSVIITDINTCVFIKMIIIDPFYNTI